MRSNFSIFSLLASIALRCCPSHDKLHIRLRNCFILFVYFLQTQDFVLFQFSTISVYLLALAAFQYVIHGAFHFDGRYDTLLFL